MARQTLRPVTEDEGARHAELMAAASAAQEALARTRGNAGLGRDAATLQNLKRLRAEDASPHKWTASSHLE